MNILRYVFNTPFEMIRRDIREYNEISRRVSDAYAAYNCARGRITSQLGENGDIAGDFEGCIVHSWGWRFDPVENQSSPIGYERECKMFRQSSPCGETQCIYCAKNAIYFQKLAEYQAQKKILDNFWKEKMTRTK